MQCYACFYCSNSPMKKSSRIILALAALSMASTYFLPLWQIQLWAPQYPEGLNMKIWHNHLGGAFDIINGLNHYIGMKLIKEEMFPELAYIGILIGIYIAIGLIAAITGKKVLLKVFVITGIVYGAAALYDFYQWGYDYGHNLDPNAAIKVPGMFYQPPVIGYKNLLNFTAYSGPDTGGWVIIVASVVAMGLLFYEWFVQRKHKTEVKVQPSSLAGAAIVFLISSCSPEGPAPIRLGQDQCDHCKMTLADAHFGAEIISNTNKVFKFDDLNCLINFMGEKPDIGQNANGIYAVNFSEEGTFVKVQEGCFLRSESLQTPMGSNIAVFTRATACDSAMKAYPDAEKLNWEKVKSLY